MAGVLPTEMVVRVLNPIVKTGDFPVNQAAIKMLTKLVERQTPDSIEPHLSELMPGLLKVHKVLFSGHMLECPEEPSLPVAGL